MTDCEHDLSGVGIISRVSKHSAVEVEGHCAKCDGTIYGVAELEVFEQ